MNFATRGNSKGTALELRRAAMGSTLVVDGPLIRRTETVPPGGRWRAYLARRVSIPSVGVGEVVGGGRRLRGLVDAMA